MSLKGLLILWLSVVLTGILLMTGCSNSQGSEIPLTVRIAESQIGKGERGGNNKGPDVRKYTRGQEVAWCAGFVSWVLQESRHQQKYLLSARGYWTYYQSHRTNHPRPGDLICFYRGSRRGRLGHIGIIEKVNGTQIITIEGNVGPYPAKVKRFTYTLGHINNLLGFVRP